MATLPKERRVNSKKQEIIAQAITINPNATTSTVTQATNRSTGVTLNTTCGQITTDTTSLAAGAEATFVVTNDKVTAKSVPIVAIASGAAATPIAYVSAVAAGQFSITISNLHASTGENGALVINFVVLGAE
jgi:hypothetical protein